jgi:uncharacterized membrane protein YsdA (DUF1294 family)
MLCLLMLLPAYALSRLTTRVDWEWLLGIPLAFSVFTFFAYRSDKRRAETGRRRIPESTLHMAELLGGWPGAFLAQRRFRHKISKTAYQVVFWGVVLLYQGVALEFLTGWQLTNSLLRLLQSQPVA